MKFHAHILIAQPDRTISALLESGRFICFLMEDAIREVEGQPVEAWKVPGETAIPGGTYPFYLENSPRFGPDTLTIAPVPGFVGIRMHPNAKSDYISHRSTEGCPIPGMRIAYLDNGRDLRLTEDEAAHDAVRKMMLAARERKEESTITFHRKAGT